MSLSFFENAKNVYMDHGTFNVNFCPSSSTAPLESNQHVRERKRCPLPVQSFEGRSRILARMDQCYPPAVRGQKVFVLYGLGGSGKSQLAFKFVEERQRNNRFSNVFYVDATTKETIRTDLEAITPLDIPSSIEATRHWLADQPEDNWLLVFDNADDTDLNLGQFFPPSRVGNILITTRNQELLNLASRGSYERVTEMDEHDAIYLLMNLSDAEETDENQIVAAQIVQDLHCFALAISHAGAYIRYHSTLQEYRKLYQRERDKLLNTRRVHSLDNYGNAVYATWKLSYQKLDDKAKTFLQVCSLLHHEGISEEMFKRAASSRLKLYDHQLQNQAMQLLALLGTSDSTWSSCHFQEITKLLGSHSLIDYDRQNGTYSIHPLVQQWSRTTMDANGPVVGKCIVAIIGLSIRWSFSDDDYRYRRTLWKHANFCKTASKPEDMDPKIGSRMALIYEEQGQWNEAEELQVIVMEKSERLLGNDHPDTLLSMGNLSNTYRNQGRWGEANALEMEVMEKRRRLLGDNHPDTITSIGNLASIYKNQGKWDDAKTLEMVVMEKRERLLGCDHPDTLLSMGNLANTYRNQGGWSEAEALEVTVLAKRKQLLGDCHPDTLISMGNLAFTYWKQGRWTEAEALQVLVMETRQKLLGDDHPDTLNSMGNLAGTYWNQGRWSDAKTLQVVVMDKVKRLLGADHPDTLLAMGNLANTYRDQECWDKAMTLEVVVLEKRKQLVGDDHPDTLVSMGNLAFTFWKQGRWSEAEALQIMVMEKSKRLLGEDHPDTLLSMANLAGTYFIQGRLDEAEALEVLVLERRKQILGDRHPDTLVSTRNLAFTYRNQGYLDKAKTLEEERDNEPWSGDDPSKTSPTSVHSQTPEEKPRNLKWWSWRRGRDCWEKIKLL